MIFPTIHHLNLLYNNYHQIITDQSLFLLKSLFHFLHRMEDIHKESHIIQHQLTKHHIYDHINHPKLQVLHNRPKLFNILLFHFLSLIYQLLF